MHLQVVAISLLVESSIAWIDLGYPKYSGGGTGLPSWLIPVKSNRIVVAFVDPNRPDEIQVQSRDLP